MIRQASPGIIEIENICKSFGSTKALDDINLTIPPGIVQGLLGPNGAGKTTLVRILTTLLTPDSGRARVGGFDVARDPNRVRSVIGLAGQYAAVDEMLTGRENLIMMGRLYRLGARLARSRADETLERLDLVEAANRPVRTYSGGMRRRLDLGASLVGQPSVLILDEPTTGLDPRTRLDLWQFIRELVKEGTTVLLTTQYLEEADQLAQDIVVIDHGRLIAWGTPQDLKNRLGGDRLEIAVLPEQIGRVVEALTGIGAEDSVVDRDRSSISIPVKNGVQGLMSAAVILQEAGIVPSELQLRRPSLDDVFLALTGNSSPGNSGPANSGPANSGPGALNWSIGANRTDAQ